MTPSYLRRWMDLHGKTIEQVAAEAGISARTVQRVLGGKTKSSKLVLSALRWLIFKNKVKKKTNRVNLQ